MNRRQFLAASAAAGIGVSFAGRLGAAEPDAKFRKALIGVPTKDVFAAWREAGFDGMETNKWQALPREAAAARETAESFEMRIHSVLFGWGKLNEGETSLAETVTQMKVALRAAKGYGADTVLFVPCRIGGMAIPRPSEFDVRFDESTGRVEQVVAGDNSPYEKYIEAHNNAAAASRQGIEQLIPVAEEAGVVIALENVWNNLWVMPDLFANFVSSFDSPWVKAYFDIGNHVKYLPPQDWIRALGKSIVKCHVKDFKLSDGGDGGEFCNIREGSVDWPAVVKALGEAGYNDWMTIEGGNLSVEEHSKRLDLIIAGK
ncbi:MAG: sugar phosphate isomerase/epimerase [Pirellulaceae bacterium]|nr:sugar phosphate isomerase/epimerase [Pirellulaceae bacterium]